MDICFKCGRNGEQVRLFDGIYVNELIKICERCSLIEQIPIVKVPSTNQLKNSERTEHMYGRLKKIAGYDEKKIQKSVFEELSELEKSPELNKPEQIPPKFVENFNWIIQRERRRKGLTHKQLADSIGESESAIRLIERNNLPENSISVIVKLEQFFRVRLVQDIDNVNIQAKKQIIQKEPAKQDYSSMSFATKISANKVSEPVFRGRTYSSFRRVAREKRETDEPSQILSFKKDKLRELTISDLKEMNRLVEKDFPTKTAEQIGREQLEDFGKPAEIKKIDISENSWQRNILSTKQVSESNKVPSISELVAKKKVQFDESPKEGILGNDIEIVDSD